MERFFMIVGFLRDSQATTSLSPGRTVWADARTLKYGRNCSRSIPTQPAKPMIVQMENQTEATVLSRSAKKKLREQASATNPIPTSIRIHFPTYLTGRNCLNVFIGLLPCCNRTRRYDDNRSFLS